MVFLSAGHRAGHHSRGRWITCLPRGRACAGSSSSSPCRWPPAAATSAPGGRPATRCRSRRSTGVPRSRRLALPGLLPVRLRMLGRRPPVPPDRTRWVRGGGELEERNARLLRSSWWRPAPGRSTRRTGSGARRATSTRPAWKRGTWRPRAGGAAGGVGPDLTRCRTARAGRRAVRLESMGLRATLGSGPRTGRPGTARPCSCSGGGPDCPGRRPEPRPGPSGGTEAEVETSAPCCGGWGARGRGGAEAAAAVGLERSLEGVPPAAERRCGTGSPRPRRGAAARAALPVGPLLAGHRGGAPRRGGRCRCRVRGAARPDVGQAPVETWRAYLRVRLVEAMAAERALPAAMVQEWFRFQRTLAPARPSSARAGSTAWTSPPAPSPSPGRAFARKHLAASGRQRAGWLVARGCSAASRDDRGRALDRRGRPESRAAAKLDRMVAQIGTPESGPDYKSLRASRDS